MAKHKTKLELTWIGKDKRPKLEPRILLEDPSKSYHAKQRVTDNDIFDNKLIFGDNLLALKALEQEYSGTVKCVFIDPPYNTGSAFKHYEDGIEHSIWLSLMRDRLNIIKNILSENGSLWITIDDNEVHYLKVICDEVFGRSNFVANVVWEKVYSERMDSKAFSNAHDHILVYQKSDKFKVNKLAKEQNTKQFNCFDKKEGKHYRRRSLRKEGSNSLRTDRPNLWYPIKAPDGTEVYPFKPSGIEGYWRWQISRLEKQMDQIEFVKKEGKWEVYVKQYLDKDASRPPSTLFHNTEAGHNHEAKLEAKSFNETDVFTTPKPERLLELIMKIATNKGDIVLDSFAGSGTTGAVAHKMRRKWIMVELEETCHTHIIPRLQKAINGEDQGGISKSVNWQGGGGFRYYTLAPSLLEKDKWDNWVVNKDYNAEMLSEAICKLEGFIYAPSETEWWNHGTSTETDFIYVTTQNLSVEKLQQLSDEVGGDKTLLLCCGSFRCKPDRFENLTIKKIPKMVLNSCEWAHDDYSLNIENLPQMEREPEQESLFPEDGGAS